MLDDIMLLRTLELFRPRCKRRVLGLKRGKFGSMMILLVASSLHPTRLYTTAIVNITKEREKCPRPIRYECPFNSEPVWPIGSMRPSRADHSARASYISSALGTDKATLLPQHAETADAVLLNIASWQLILGPPLLFLSKMSKIGVILFLEKPVE